MIYFPHMPEPIDRGEQSSIGEFMKAGAIPKTEPSKMDNRPTAGTVLSEPIPGTVFGSAREKWDEQIALGNIPRTAIAEADLVNLSDPDEEENKRRTEMEMAYAYQSREEEFARRDRLLSRLMKAENPKDVAAVLEILADTQDWSKAEANDRYTYTQYVKTALDGARAFRKTAKQLEEEGIIEGPSLKDGSGGRGPAIGSDGYLVEGAKVLQRGYAIKVDEIKDLKPVRGGKEVMVTVKERVYFGSDEERKALASAHEQLMRTLIVSEKIHEMTGAFDANRAALEEMVKYFYIRQVGLQNEQIGWVFTAADIDKITVEKPNNQEAGSRRSKSIRGMFIMGNCETKEKMEAHLNDTYNLEKFLDKATIERAKKLMVATNFSDPEAENIPGVDDTLRVARFLIGKGLTRENGTWHVNWLTKDERDPSKVNTEEEKNKRGLGAVKQEKNKRGFLTEFGNPYTRGSRDTVYQLNNRLALLVGNKDDVKIADRLFWTWGERDELGLEQFATLPTGEEFLKKFNELTAIDYDEWRNWANERLRYFSLPGEPIGSDLSKIFYARWYRLKDLLNDRPTGSALTINEFDRLTQSLMTLCRTEVQVGGEGVVRSIKEQFLGHKPNDGLSAEPAKEMGEIGWEQVTTPAEIEDAMVGEDVRSGLDKAKVDAELGIRSGSASDNAMGYFWLMNFLAGDGNPDKRPWAMINDENPDPRKFMKASGFTAKNKFLTIVWHDAALVYGEWRKKQIEARAEEGATSKDRVSRRIKKEAEAKWKRGRKNYWHGVRSLPDYSTWEDQQIKIRTVEQEQRQKSVISIVEGVSGKPGLAVRFGFMDMNEVQKPPKHRMSIIG